VNASCILHTIRRYSALPVWWDDEQGRWTTHTPHTIPSHVPCYSHHSRRELLRDERETLPNVKCLNHINRGLPSFSPKYPKRLDVVSLQPHGTHTLDRSPSIKHPITRNSISQSTPYFYGLDRSIPHSKDETRAIQQAAQRSERRRTTSKSRVPEIQ
jgi:hypothetical protein